MAERTVRVDVYEDGKLVHNAFCRDLVDIAAASQGRMFVLIPPKDMLEQQEWDIEYYSNENMNAIGQETY